MCHRFLVTTAKGLEPLLADELRNLGLEPSVEPSGTVCVEGDWHTAATILVRSRIPSRLVWSVGRLPARTPAMLYDQVRRIRWPELFSPELAIAVDAKGAVANDRFALSFAPLKIKDAICDEYRKFGLPRPDVDKQQPDVRVSAFFLNGRCELSLDLAGEPLHRRGYRAAGAEAPLRENRAAALLQFLGYDGSRPFVDPFCGSGTLVIEAVLIARRMAPGLLAESEFALARIRPEAVEALDAVRRAARAERLDAAPHPIRGSDLDPEALEVARGNAAKSGVLDSVQFERADARELSAPDAFIACNPPYGERLASEEEAAQLLRDFADRLKHHAPGSDLALVVPRGVLEKSVGLRFEKRLALESGPLGLRFLRYALYRGSRKG